MTFKFPKQNILDKILRFLGKKRGVIIPTETYDKFSPYVYVKARKENFWKALLRPRNRDLPGGMINIFSFQIHGQKT